MKKISIAIIIAMVTVLAASSAVWAGEPADGQEDLITVQEPALSENGYGYVEWIDEIPVDAAEVEVTEEEVDNTVDEILSGKEDAETDAEFIERYSAEHLEKELHSVEELRDYVRADLYHSKLQAAIFRVLQERLYVDSYPEETFELLKEYAGQELQQQVEMYEWFGLEGWDEQKVAEDLGYASVEDFLIAEAIYYGNAVMLLDDLAQSNRITCNDKEVEDAIRDLMEYYGYGDEMTLDEYIEFNGGDPWLLMVEKLNVEYHKVLSAMEKYAVIEETEDLSQTDEEDAPDAGVEDPAAKKNESPYTDLTSFTATTIGGVKVSPELFAGKDLTIMNIWTTWCGFCIEEMPVLAEYAAGLPDNIQMVTFCLDGVSEGAEARRILEESGMLSQDVVTLISGTGDLETLDSQVIYFPVTLFFNSKGELIGEPLIGGQLDLKTALDEHVQQALEA